MLAISNTGLEEPYDEATIEALEQLFEELDNQIAGVILGSADLTLPSKELISRLEKFQNWAFALRKIILQIHNAHHGHTAENLTLTVDDSEKP